MRTELLTQLKNDFQEEGVRYAYAEDLLNASIAAQIKALRDARGMKQQELAERLKTKQPAVARFENINYASWNIETLRKLARAFGVRLKITFEDFGSIFADIENLKSHLAPPKFEDDAAFKEQAGIPSGGPLTAPSSYVPATLPYYLLYQPTSVHEWSKSTQPLSEQAEKVVWVSGFTVNEVSALPGDAATAIEDIPPANPSFQQGFRMPPPKSQKAELYAPNLQTKFIAINQKIGEVA